MSGGNFLVDTNFLMGTLNNLRILSKKIKNDYNISLKVYAVQPGLSKAKYIAKTEDSNEVETLFTVTEDYIKATKQGEFFVMCSP